MNALQITKLKSEAGRIRARANMIQAIAGEAKLDDEQFASFMKTMQRLRTDLTEIYRRLDETVVDE